MEATAQMAEWEQKLAQRIGAITRSADPTIGQPVTYIELRRFSVEGAIGRGGGGVAAGTPKNDLRWLVNYVARVDDDKYLPIPDGSTVPAVFYEGGRFTNQQDLLAWADRTIEQVNAGKIELVRRSGPKPGLDTRGMNMTTGVALSIMTSYWVEGDVREDAQYQAWRRAVIDALRERYGDFLLAIIEHLDGSHLHINAVVGCKEKVVPIAKLLIGRQPEDYLLTPERALEIDVARAAGTPLRPAPAPAKNAPKPRPEERVTWSGPKFIDWWHKLTGEPFGAVRRLRDAGKKIPKWLAVAVKIGRNELMEADSIVLARQREVAQRELEMNTRDKLLEDLKQSLEQQREMFRTIGEGSMTSMQLALKKAIQERDALKKELDDPVQDFKAAFRAVLNKLIGATKLDPDTAKLIDREVTASLSKKF